MPKMKTLDRLCLPEFFYRIWAIWGLQEASHTDTLYNLINLPSMQFGILGPSHRGCKK